MKQFKKYGVEFFMSLFGVVLLALGLALIVKASIGLDPWGVLFNGALNAYNKMTPEAWHVIKYGDMITILSTLFVFIASFMKKEPIKWLSILSGFFLGQFVNIWLSFILPIPMTSGPLRIESYFVLLLGIVILSMGSTVSLTFSMLMSPVDYLVLAIKDKFPNKDYGMVRIGADTSAVILGSIITLLFTQNISAILIGIGTVIMFFGVGYVINLLLPMITPLLKRLK